LAIHDAQPDQPVDNPEGEDRDSPGHRGKRQRDHEQQAAGGAGDLQPAWEASVGLVWVKAAMSATRWYS
jgi:hypothetical protein